MFTIDKVTLRPLEFEDLDTLYAWEYDIELAIRAGWTRILSYAAFKRKFEQRVADPDRDMLMLAIDYEGKLVGSVQLALIDERERRAIVGIVIGKKEVWGQGIGSIALRILLDYAFSVKGLERIYAEVYGFNLHSQRLMESVGFQKEGILRQHEVHNGVRQDMHFFGILKPEFYERYETIFKLPS